MSTAPHPVPVPPLADDNDVAYRRLEDQIAYYDRQAGSTKVMYRRLKMMTFVMAGLVPLSALVPYGSRIAAVLGFLIVLAESIQQLNQYQQNWILYRATAEALKHEKYLYLSKAGAYAEAAEPRRHLAEKVESLVSQEHARWTAAQENAVKQQGGEKK